MSKRVNSRLVGCLVIGLVLGSGAAVYGFPREQLIQGIKGPWELSVSFGQQDDSGAVFPVFVADEDRRQTLDKVFPVVGTPIQVKVLEYCPNLQWEMIAAEDPNGGPTATIVIEGKGAQQEVTLLAHVPERRAVTARIGGLAIRQIHQSSAAESLLKNLAKPKTVGMLTVWADPEAEPLEVTVREGDSIAIPGTSYTADILAYMPHYSIDPQSKTVKNFSDQPVNPAVNVRLSDAQNTYEQWVWSNFSTSPHARSAFPLRVEFNDFDAGPSDNRYFIVTTDDSWWLYYEDDRGIHVEKGEYNHPYPFKEEGYTFTVKTILAHGTLDRKWVNRSDRLERPALVVSVESDKQSRQAVVELNRPTPVETAFGMLVLQYQQKTPAEQRGPQ